MLEWEIFGRLWLCRGGRRHLLGVCLSRGLGGWCYGLTLWVGYLPCFDLGIPLASPLPALYFEVGGDYLAYLNCVLVDVVVQQGDSDLAWVLPLRLEDKHLLAPRVTRLGDSLL